MKTRLLVGITIGIFLVVAGIPLMIISMWQPVTRTVSFADLDGDGDLDALVGNGHTDDTGSPNTVWLNNGLGYLKNTGQRLGETYDDTQQVTLGDLNGDGTLDAVFANQNSISTVFINDGTAQFQKFSELRLPEKGYNAPFLNALALGDLDSDGDLDLFAGACCRGQWIANMAGGQTESGYGDSYNQVFFNDGTGRFVRSDQILDNTSTANAALGDLDGDGDLDAFVTNLAGDPKVMIGSPADTVWLNDGRGSFTKTVQRLGESNSTALALGDVDGDEDLDAFVGNSYFPRFKNDRSNDASRQDVVWLNDGRGNFNDSGQRLGNADTRFAVLSDMDGDGDLDAFLQYNRESRILWNDGSGRFTQAGPRFSPGSGYAFNVADIDGDSDLDVIGFHIIKGYRLWRNNGTGSFTLAH